MELEDLAKRIRDACVEAVREAYDDAGVQGLCPEGRWEAPVGALRTLDLAPLLRVSSSSRFQIANPWSATVRAARPSPGWIPGVSLVSLVARS